MNTRMLSMLCLALTLVTFGCDKGQTDDHAHDEATAEAAADEQELAAVEVAESGSRFDPAVQVQQIPAGAWYCDMGTVHWAGMHKPEDGKCPECGMKLKQSDPDKLADQKKEAVEAHDHGDHAHEGDDHAPDDHAHGEEGHAHGDDHGHAH